MYQEPIKTKQTICIIEYSMTSHYACFISKEKEYFALYMMNIKSSFCLGFTYWYMIKQRFFLIFSLKKVTYFYYFESCQDYGEKRLKAFSVNNGWAGFIVFLFAYPHGLEG